MSNYDRCIYSGCTDDQVLQFEPESQDGTTSFHTLQVQNKALLTSSTNIQEQMATNRHTRLLAKKQLSESYRQLAQESSERSTQSCLHAHMQYLRQKIIDLEQDHILLHQQFISLQSRFREMVRSQRRQLLDTITQTRARTSRVSCGGKMVSDMPDRQPANNDDSSGVISHTNVIRKYA